MDVHFHNYKCLIFIPKSDCNIKHTKWIMLAGVATFITVFAYLHLLLYVPIFSTVCAYNV